MTEQKSETHAPDRVLARAFLQARLALYRDADPRLARRRSRERHAGSDDDLFWEVLVPFFAASASGRGLRDAQHQSCVGRLIRIEALHWGAVFLAMHVVTYVPDVNRIMNARRPALMMLTILALGTFTAGAQIGAWRICVVGACWDWAFLLSPGSTARRCLLR